jgi:hypothetical protein
VASNDSKGRSVIEVRVRELTQLFESMDPSPFVEQDLDRHAEEFILESVKGLQTKAELELRVYVTETPQAQEERALEHAIRSHFAREATLVRRQLRELMRDGVRSLVIGLTFLVAFFVIGQAVIRMLGENPWSTLARESLLIGGWVAMWRPLEIFLHAWWPIVRNRRLLERLSRMDVRVVPPTAKV